MTMGAMMTVRALWVGPYLADVHGLDLVARGHVILALSLAWLVSALIYGPMDRVLDTRRGVVSAGMVAMTAALAALAVFGGAGIATVTVLLVLFGLVASPTAAAMTHVRDRKSTRLNSSH